MRKIFNAFCKTQVTQLFNTDQSKLQMFRQPLVENFTQFSQPKLTPAILSEVITKSRMKINFKSLKKDYPVTTFFIKLTLLSLVLDSLGSLIRRLSLGSVNYSVNVHLDINIPKTITLEPITLANYPDETKHQNFLEDVIKRLLLLDNKLLFGKQSKQYQPNLPDGLTRRINTLSISPFAQHYLLDTLRESCPEFKDNKGLCFALRHLWFIYQSLGLDLIKELNRIDTYLRHHKPLNTEQEKILKNLLLLQNNQGNHFAITIEEKQRSITLHLKNNLENIEGSANTLPGIIGTGIKLTASFPGNRFNYNLVGLGLYNDLVGHACGITLSDMEPNILKYFDANAGEVIFNNNEAAKKDIINMLEKAEPNEKKSCLLRTYSLRESHPGFFIEKSFPIPYASNANKNLCDDIAEKSEFRNSLNLNGG